MALIEWFRRFLCSWLAGYGMSREFGTSFGRCEDTKKAPACVKVGFVVGCDGGLREKRV